MTQQEFLAPQIPDEKIESFTYAKPISMIRLFEFDNSADSICTIIILIVITSILVCVISAICKKNSQSPQRSFAQPSYDTRVDTKVLIKADKKEKKRQAKKKRVYMYPDPSDPTKVVYVRYLKKKQRYVPISCDAVMKIYSGINIYCIDSYVVQNGLPPQSSQTFQQEKSERKNKTKKIYVFQDQVDPGRLVYAKYSRKTSQYVPVNYQQVSLNYNQIEMTYMDNQTYQQQANLYNTGVNYAPPSEYNQYY